MKHRRIVFTIAALSCSLWTAAGYDDEGGSRSNSLNVSPTSLTFSAVANAQAPASQQIRVTANSATRFTASASGRSGERTWLSISPSGQLTTDRTLTVSVNQTGLGAGTYNGSVTLTTSRSTQTVPVTLTVTRSSSGITMSPTSLTFNATAGGQAPASQSVTVSAASRTSFTASSSGGSWLSISPSGSLNTNQTLTVSVNPSQLSAGTYTGAITATASGSTRTTSVTLVVSGSTSGGAVSVSPRSMTFNATAGGTAPAGQTLSVTAASRTTFSANATVSSGGVTWLSISPSGSLSTNQNIVVTASPSGLAAGNYSGSIAISANGSTTNVPVSFAVASSSGGGGGTPTSFKLIGWNDLGMHCFDGADYSIFGVLPPYNTIHAHLIDGSGKLVVSPTGYSISYQAVNDPMTNTMNTSSIGKTNFWQYASALGFGLLNPDMGLKGYAMPGSSNTPQAMNFTASDNTWIAEGIPITPFVDSTSAPYPRNYFPMMRLVAKNSSGAVVATQDIVLPTSDEMTCSVCHASNSGAAAMPANGWANNSNMAKDVKINILRKHDDRFKNTALFQSAAGAVGYNVAGLEATTASKPILCATCHATNALGMAGVAGIPALTVAMHSLHSGVIEPSTGQTMESSTSRNTCYSCHPGPNTQCVRGVMGNAKTSTGANAMECQSCHGPMSAMANPARQGWLEEPNCQSCHTGTATSNSGAIVYTSVFSSGTTVRTPANQTFATNANTPAAGLSLYRFSKGHGGLQCEACHGSTHAEFATSITNDNVQSNNIQGHDGTLAECSSCHGSDPSTTNGGPHGLHPVGSGWVSRHQSVAGGNQASCQPCHGTDYRGTVLSKTFTNRTLNGRSFPKGTMIGCYSCHNGPNGG